MAILARVFSGLFLIVAIVAGPAARADTFETLYRFNNPDGVRPLGSLLVDRNGILYGTTSEGGSKYEQNGTIFKLDPNSGAFTKLYNFSGADGQFPTAGLVHNGRGMFYGTTSQGGRNGRGTIFQFDPSTDTFTSVYSFSGADGVGPGGLAVDAHGVLYGTTIAGGSSSIHCPDGCGTIFKFDPSEGRLTTLYSFTGTSADGLQPQASMVWGANGVLYGTTRIGGANGTGIVFAFDPATASLTVVHSFLGAFTYAGVAIDAQGMLYGTTWNGGTHDKGTVFKLDPASGVMTTIRSFGGIWGKALWSGVIVSQKGMLFGTTSRGGANNLGVVFKLDPADGKLSILHSFAGADGTNPKAGLVIGEAGVLYGTTYLGGLPCNRRLGCGSIFSITP